jgi:hypothetical protein
MAQRCKLSFNFNFKIFYEIKKILQDKYCATISLLDNEHLTFINCYGATCNLVKVVKECTPEDDALASKHVGWSGVV